MKIVKYFVLLITCIFVYAAMTGGKVGGNATEWKYIMGLTWLVAMLLDNIPNRIIYVVGVGITLVILVSAYFNAGVPLAEPDIKVGVGEAISEDTANKLVSTFGLVATILMIVGCIKWRIGFWGSLLLSAVAFVLGIFIGATLFFGE